MSTIFFTGWVMFDQLVDDVREFYFSDKYAITEAEDTINDIIERTKHLSFGHNIPALRAVGAELLIQAIRASFITFPNSNFPSSALVSSNISAAAQSHNTNTTKQIRLCLKALLAAKKYYAEGNEMGFFGAVSRAVVSAAMVAVSPVKKDQDLKIIHSRVKAHFQDKLKALDVTAANDEEYELQRAYG